MNRVFAHAVGGFGDQLAKDVSAEKERKAKAAELAKERLFKAESQSKLLEQEYKLKREAKRAELKDKQEFLFGALEKGEGAFGNAKTVFQELPEDIRPDFMNAYTLAMADGDYEGGTKILSSASTMVGKLRTQGKEEVTSEINPKWKGDFTPEKFIEDKDNEVGFVYTLPKLSNPSPEVTENRRKFRSIMARIGKDAQATDDQGKPIGVIDVENPESLAQATSDLIAGVNFAKDWQMKKYATDRAFKNRAEKDKELAKEKLTNAFTTFEQYGIDITAPEYDDFFSPQEMKIIDQVAKDLGLDVEDVQAPKETLEPLPELENVGMTTKEQIGKAYGQGKISKEEAVAKLKELGLN